MAKRKTKVNEVLTTYFKTKEERSEYVNKYKPRLDKCIAYWIPNQGYALEVPQSFLKKTG